MSGKISKWQEPSAVVSCKRAIAFSALQRNEERINKVVPNLVRFQVRNARVRRYITALALIFLRPWVNVFIICNDVDPRNRLLVLIAGALAYKKVFLQVASPRHLPSVRDWKFELDLYVMWHGYADFSPGRIPVRLYTPHFLYDNTMRRISRDGEFFLFIGQPPSLFNFDGCAYSEIINKFDSESMIYVIHPQTSGAEYVKRGTVVKWSDIDVLPQRVFTISSTLVVSIQAPSVQKFLVTSNKFDTSLTILQSGLISLDPTLARFKLSDL